MSDDDALLKSLQVLDGAARELSKLGFDNVRVSELFISYALRIGALEEGLSVFKTARIVIDAMEKRSTGSNISDH